MSKNVLFNYASKYAKPFFITSDGTNVPVQENISILNGCYCLLTIARPQEDTFNLDRTTLRLRDHHFNINEKEALFEGEPSPYHYTAYFQSDENRQYRLHAYFNREGKCIRKALSIELVDSMPIQWSEIDSKSLDESFEQLVGSILLS